MPEAAELERRATELLQRLILLRAAFISFSTNGWHRMAPCPKMMRLRVRMFAPSTVMAMGMAW